MTPGAEITPSSGPSSPDSLRLRWPSQGWPRVIPLIVLIAIYYGAARLGLMLAVVHDSASAVWPPTGIALAAVLLYGRGVWPAIAAGAFFANLHTSGSVPASAAIAAGNAAEALLGGALVHRWAGGAGALWHVPGVFRFVAAGSLLPALVSATIGVVSLVAAGLAAQADFAETWMTWWLGDMIGAAVYAPFVIFWIVRPPERWRERRPSEQLFVGAALAVLGWFTFTRLSDGGVASSTALLGLPLVVWAAFRLGQREAATCVVVLSAIALWGTFAGAPPANASVLIVQSFAAVLALTGAAVAALAFQHRQLQASLERRVALRTNELAEANTALRLEMQAREETRDALRASEQRLLEAQTVAHIGSWEWEIGPNRVWWSDELCEIYGTPGLTPSYEEFLERVHPDDRERVQTIVATAYTNGQPFAY